MVSIKGENLHNHQFINFKITNDTFKNDQLHLDRNVKVSGIMEITTNGDIKWNKIKTNISIYNDNTIIIDFDDKSPINLLDNLYMELLNKYYNKLSK